MKKDPSQVGINAREAVRFLDRVTSGKDSIPVDKIILQGPMEMYETWSEVEAYLREDFDEQAHRDIKEAGDEEGGKKDEDNNANEEDDKDNSANDLSQVLLNKLNFKEGDVVSTTSAETHRTLPISPSSSKSQSSTTSPEFTAAKLADASKAGVPDGSADKRSSSSSTPKGDMGGSISGSKAAVTAAIQPLLNSILWRLHNQDDTSDTMANCILITNDPVTSSSAEKFGITAKNIHQLRTAIVYEDKESKNRSKYLEKVNHVSSDATQPKATFKYENDSDEEVVVFVPRGRGVNKFSRGSMTTRANHRRTPLPGMGRAENKKIVVPSEPIDPDSFSRSAGITHTPVRDGRTIPSGPSRALARGSMRGRGKLWVP